MTIQDFGPHYAETLPGRFPVEPFNTYSNILFLVILLYWGYRTRLNYKQFPAITLCLPMLAVGFVGGTIFHATRSANIWLFLDFIPISILVILGCVFFILRLTKSRLKTCAWIIIPLALSRLVIWGAPIPRHFAIGLGYSSMALLLLFPAIILWHKEQRGGLALLLAAISFAIAITFRQSDAALSNLMPMGSHWLWHVFGAISTHCMLKVIASYEEQL